MLKRFQACIDLRDNFLRLRTGATEVSVPFLSEHELPMEASASDELPARVGGGGTDASAVPQRASALAGRAPSSASTARSAEGGSATSAGAAALPRFDLSGLVRRRGGSGK